MSKLDPDFVRWLQRVSALVIYVFAAGYLKLSPEILQVVAGMCGAMAGQTLTGYDQVSVTALKKLDVLLKSKYPSQPPPP